MNEQDEEEAAVEAAASEAVSSILSALSLPTGDVMLTPAVFIPPGVRLALAENPTQRELLQEKLQAGWKPPTIEEDRLRIQKELDPIGMAIAIAQGMSIPVYVPQAGGQVKVTYVQVPTKTRIQILRMLADRASPVPSRVGGKKDGNPALEGAAQSFLAMVERAAQLSDSRRRPVIEAEFCEVPPTEEEKRMFDGEAANHKPEPSRHDDDVTTTSRRDADGEGPPALAARPDPGS